MRKDIQAVLLTISESENIINPCIIITELNLKGLSYMSKLYTAQIKGDNKKLDLFIKESVSPETTNGIFKINDAYGRETTFYRLIAPKYSQMQTDANIPTNLQYNFPTYYGTNTLESGEVIVLENLQTAGYVTIGRYDAITLDYGINVVKSLAKFHAMSFIHKIKDPANFKKDIEVHQHLFAKKYETREAADAFTNKYVIAAQSVLESKHKSVDLIRHCGHYNYFDYAKPTDDAVLLHGDFKIPNIFVKYDEKHKITSVVNVDYQLVRCGDPLDDLLFFLVANVDGSYRTNYFMKTLDTYLNTLHEFLTYFGQDPEAIYSREHLNKALESRMGYILIQALIALPFLTLSDQEIPGQFKFGEMWKTLEKVKCNEEYVSRIDSIVEFYVEHAFLFGQ